MSGKLAAKTAVVTGAGSGIGRAISCALADEGANVLAFDVVEDHARETAAAVEALGRGALWVCGDVSDAAALDSAISEAVRRFGTLDVMVNNAGVFDGAVPCIEASDEAFDRVIAINLRGVFHGMRRALQEMVPVGQGAIVNTASIAGLGAGGGGSIYTAAKFGIVGLTRQVASEVAQHGIRVNAVAPGLIATRIFETSRHVLGSAFPEGPLARGAMSQLADAGAEPIPMKRPGEAEEVARVVAFLASDDASYVTGEVITVDGGFRA